jgi:hypothetical protein
VVKFKQAIKPGNQGRDVRAVKRTMVRMHVSGSGAMGKSNFAGEAFVKCIKKVQKNHGLKQDGIYGKLTHKEVAPHFRAYDRILYRTAKSRNPPHPPATDLSAQSAARRLLELHTQGKYHTDNPGDLYDIQRTAQGKPVWSPLGYWVHLDKRPLEMLVWLIDTHDLKIGTFALCSDHHTLDGKHGHNGGHAVDIDSINNESIRINSPTSRANTLKVMDLLRNHAPVELKPWQLICDGYGYHYDGGISSLMLPSASFYDYDERVAHRNHIHTGYWGD